MKHGDDRSSFVRPAVEALERRTLFATTAVSPSFVVAGTGQNPFGGSDVARILRIDGLTGSTTLVAQFGGVGLNPPPPLLTRIDDLALAPGGELVVAGEGTFSANASNAPVVKVVRVNPATSAATLVTQYTSVGLQAPAPLIDDVSGVATAADGTIFLAGTGLDAPFGGTNEIVKILRVNPADGTTAVVISFAPSFNVPAVIESVADVAVLPSGDVIIAGVGKNIQLGNFNDVVKVIRVNPAGGAASIVTQFVQTGLNAPPGLTSVASLAVDAAGNILVAGEGIDLAAGGSFPKVLRLDPTTGTATNVTVFGESGTATVLSDISGVAFAPVQGAVGVAGTRTVTVGSVSASVPRVARVNQTTGAKTVIGKFQSTVNTGSVTTSTSFLLLKSVTGIAAGPVELSAAPVTTVSGPKRGAVGRAKAFVFKATVPKSERPADGIYTYAIDWNADGTTDQTLTGGRKLKVRHAFDVAGTFTIAATANGRNGAVGVTGSHSVAIAAPP